MPSLLLLSQFPGRWTSCHFHCAGFLSNSVSTMWAFAELGFSCAWPSLHRRWAKVVSARLNPRNGTRYVRGVCHFLGSVSPWQKFEAADQCHSLVTAQFYLASKGKDILEVWREAGPKDKGKREAQFWLLFLKYVFSPPCWAFPMQTGLANKRVCLFHLKFSLWSVDFLLFRFQGIFPFFVF